jgi:ribosomal protein S18 acetylase RimI-like enzyme
MTTRRAGADDFEAIAALWRELDHEIPPPIHEGPADVDKELSEVAEILASEIAFVAEDEGAAVGFALARQRTATLGTLTDLYVAQDARRSGVGSELMRQVLAAFTARGIEHIDLEVLASNTVARSLYGRWGFRDDVVVMTGAIADLEGHLGRQEAASFGSSSRDFPVLLRDRSWLRHETAGSLYTTMCVTATRTCFVASLASSATGWDLSRCSSVWSGTSSSG